MDSTKFRVTLICACGGEFVEGYGATPEAADLQAQKFYQRDHRKEKRLPQRTLEHAVVHDAAGGSHFEPFGDQGGKP